MTSERLQARVDLLGESILREGSLTLTAEGTSMHPAIRSGERITVRPPASFGFGDVLQCRAGESTVVHRLVRTLSRDGKVLYVTKGDNHPAFDDPVGPGDVLGVVEGGRSRVLALLSLAQGAVFACILRNRFALFLGKLKCRFVRRSLLLDLNRVVGALLRRSP